MEDMKVLPIEEVPIGAWAEQNFLFGILKTVETGWDWIMNQFIQLRGAHYIQYKYGVVDSSITFYPYSIHQLTPNMFDLCPFVNKYTIPRTFVKENYKSFFEFVVQSLEKGFYLSTFINQFFREDMGENTAINHPCFIYGYNKEDKIIYIIDNFERGKYKSKMITEEVLEKAFEKVSGDLWEVSVFLYKLIPYHHTFSTSYVREQIEDYLNPNQGICYFNRTVCMESVHNDEDYLNEVFFGVDCYALLIRYLTSIIDGDMEFMDKDWRSFVMLSDHKALMLERYYYMSEKNYMERNEELEAGLIQLKKECDIVRNLFLKYAVTNSTLLLFKIGEHIHSIHDNDVKYMNMFKELIVE